MCVSFQNIANGYRLSLIEWYCFICNMFSAIHKISPDGNRKSTMFLSVILVLTVCF